ncbi:hypothetical protein [Belliella aquatica]|uniref:Uncharacterized protein n=1 Tax=Belliella aquatica TaxID=1323734 RepID=A0ABQ1N754_9BACT|nr:hypothetical protein [Belliella aquatica]MCH7407108.1 hypothetical protein [Belliella aquatica]GGC52108.1 hypothetical protein GCM10010993_33230 [Belliella aquatica]
MFDQFYQQASDQLKVSFLTAILEQDEQLKEKFINYYLKPSDKQLALTVTDQDDFILASKDLIKANLESIRFDELNLSDFVPTHNGYIQGYDALEQMAEEEISRIIGVHVAEVERYCSINHFDLAFLYMIGIYRACLEAKLNKEYYEVPEPTLTMLNVFENHLDSCLPIFKAIQIPEDQLFTIATVLFDQHNELEAKDSHFLLFFEACLYSLIHSGSEASILLDVIEEKNKATHLPWLYTELHRKTGGIESYEKSALKYYQSSVHVALDLLDLYKSTNSKKFRNIAKQLWDKGHFHHEFAELYFEVLNLDEDPDLYLEVTQYLIKRKFSKKHYKIIQKLMKEEGRMKYLRTLQNDHPAYITALCMEGKYSEARNHALLHTNRWNIVETMTPCLEHDPEQGIVVLAQKVEELLLNERGRNLYARVATILKVAREIPAIRSQTEVLINKIVYTNGRLSALKGELRIAGII